MKARILQFEPALLGMDQGFHSCRNRITLRGQWVYPPHAATLMAGLIRSGLVDLDHFEIVAFGLDRANEAVAHAAGHSGPFKMTVIKPR